MNTYILLFTLFVWSLCALRVGWGIKHGDRLTIATIGFFALPLMLLIEVFL